MRLSSFSIVSLMISAMFIWIYVLNSFWFVAKELLAVSF